jgi:alpha/beta superfamily hydrolase
LLVATGAERATSRRVHDFVCARCGRRERAEELPDTWLVGFRGGAFFAACCAAHACEIQDGAELAPALRERVAPAGEQKGNA